MRHVNWKRADGVGAGGWAGGLGQRRWDCDAVGVLAGIWAVPCLQG